MTMHITLDEDQIGVFITPRRYQDQPLEVSFATAEGGIVRRTLDRGDRSVVYHYAEWDDVIGEYRPWGDEAPEVRDWIPATIRAA